MLELAVSSLTYEGFADTQYGPEFEPVADLILQKGCTPTLICESAGTQAEDAAQMRDIYLERGGSL